MINAMLAVKWNEIYCFQQQTLVQKGKHGMKRRLLIGCGSFFLLVFAAYCGIVEYTARTTTAHIYLQRLTGSQEQWMHDEEAQNLLIKRFPPATPLATILPLLEQAGIEQDRFTGGQLMRYQIHPYKLLVLLSDPPWVPNIICSNTGYIIHFDLDAENRLVNIVVHTSGACL